MARGQAASTRTGNASAAAIAITPGSEAFNVTVRVGALRAEVPDGPPAGSKVPAVSVPASTPEDGTNGPMRLMRKTG